MTRGIVTFLATFVAGALIALAARAALHDPHDAATVSQTAADYAPMVRNALTPAASAPPAGAPGGGMGHAEHSTTPEAAPAEHAGNSAHATPAPTATAKPVAGESETVNTRCAICGMDVDPSLPTAEYQGKKIGFGCRMCPPKFKADPDKYGPIYLRNEVIKR